MHKLADTLRGLYPERFLENEPMSRHTTFRVGGPADLMAFPASEEQLCAVLAEAGQAGVPVLVMGNGSPSAQFRGGTPDTIAAATRQLLDRCSQFSNFVISSGCDIPPQSPWENIDAFFAAAKGE